MISVPRFFLLIILGMVFGTRLDFSFSKPVDQTSPIYNLSDNTYIREWLVAGPFPNPPTDEPLPDGSYHYGYYTDFLKSIGGERQAVFESQTIIQFSEPDGVTRRIRPQRLQAEENGMVDFDKLFQQTDQKVAYAFCFINSDKNQAAQFLLGSDDGV
ncbi:hypothetical protein L0128_11415 [candidate division KSB1 bacterium]|nr:hypothetical protein [candidate division KSB1 bacterium]